MIQNLRLPRHIKLSTRICWERNITRLLNEANIHSILTMPIHYIRKRIENKDKESTHTLSQIRHDFEVMGTAK